MNKPREKKHSHDTYNLFWHFYHHLCQARSQARIYGLWNDDPNVSSKLIDQSQYNRRTHGFYLLVEALQKCCIIQKGWHRQSCYLLGTKPVPIIGYTRDKRYSDFLRSANYWIYASKSLHYFDYKLVTITTLDDI